MFNRLARSVAGALVLACAVGLPAAASAKPSPAAPTVRELASFAAPGCTGGCGSGSTIGPDGALYVTDGKAGRVLRIDPGSGDVMTFASGLPRSLEAVGIGGAIDVAFVRRTAYVLVTLVGPAFGQAGVVDGIYRVEQDGSVTPVADIGSWSISNPPATDYFVSSGVQYALQAFRDGLLVTDGHHNRVLQVALDGAVSEVIAFGDIVPTGIDVHGDTVLMAEAGPVPHVPETGRIVVFRPGAATAKEIAAGAPLLVDVERGRGGRLYALSQGFWDWPDDPANAGKPAAPNTGTLVRAEKGGSLTPLVFGLDRPTSLELVGTTAYVITLTGTVVRIDGVPK
jgi:sugar lactone lactonase YvrE